MRVRIYTDGACSGNPGPGGWGAIILLSEDRIELSGFQRNTTNNSMEIKAVLEALRKIKEMHPLRNMKVDIYSDSAYVVNAIKDKWLKKWQLNGWKTTSKEEVKNKELWVQMIDLLNSSFEINFIKVKGHSGDINNERADKLARTQIEKNR